VIHRVLVAVLLTACCASVVQAADPLVSGAAGTGSFALVKNKAAASVAYDASDYTVVRLASELFAGDVRDVTGIKPELRPANGQPATLGKQTVFVGTLGHSPLVDAIIKDKNINVSAIKDQWESYLITTVDNPAPGVDKGLLVIGSDRRGTAFGLLSLSQEAGVSPWTWWADVPAKKQAELYVAAGTHLHGPPSVKYRGIFINDEDWGMKPWSAKTIEPKSAGGVGDIGPKTYAHIFELLLRLNANYCWPAMHACTQAFNNYPENKKVADDYAIVMGSSHCEMLLRNNVTEWRDDQSRVGQAAGATYNWVTNKQGLLDYWAKRLEENGKYENTYTLGLRGVHDSDMTGGGTPKQKADRLLEIFAAQKDLLTKYVNPDITKVPQVFCDYKEQLIYYQNGAIPPDYVTLAWADDNHGYIRQLSTPEEQKRSGGSGVYYHLSYWGVPQDYLWLDTIPPALIWEELSKAYDYNARTLWVVNVGDLKPMEIGTDFAMAYAYDTSRYTLDNLGNYLQDFAARTFGTAQAANIAAILNDYYHLNYQRKPEHMGLTARGGNIDSSLWTDQEIADRLAAFDALMQRADAVSAKLPKELADAYFELVLYPVRGSALQNHKILNMELNKRATARGDSTAAQAAADRAKAAYDRIQTETAYYNDTLAGGKWKYMMSAAPRGANIFRAPTFAQATPATAPAAASEIKPHTNTSVAITGPQSFAEKSRYVSMAAEHPTRNLPRNNATWKVIPTLGRLGDSMAVFPTTTPSVTDVAALATSSPALEYDFTIATANPAAKVTLQAIPTHRINPERSLRYAVAIDNETPQVINLETPENNATWSENVLRGAALGTTTHNLAAGKHTLRLYMVDPGLVADHLTIDLGGLPKSYLPPAETLNGQ
jgi:hypothetical protein